MLEDTNAECRPRSCAAPCCPVSRTWCTVTRHFSKENWDNFTKQAKKKQRFTHIRWGTRISKLCPFNLLPLRVSQAACKCRKKAYNFFLNYKWMHLPPHSVHDYEHKNTFFLQSWILPCSVQRTVSGKQKAGVHRTAGIIQGFINICSSNRHDKR